VRPALLAPLGPLALTLAVVLSACGTASSGDSAGGPGRHQPGPTSPLHLTATSDGSTVTLALGQQVDVSLDGVQWTFAAPTATGPLRAVAAPTAVATRCTPVGSGCGTSSESFAAASPGTTRLAAHRDSCGEALACTGRRGDWQVTVVVR
jgi:hypothetical protein